MGLLDEVRGSSGWCGSPWPRDWSQMANMHARKIPSLKKKNESVLGNLPSKNKTQRKTDLEVNPEKVFILKGSQR